MSEEISKRTVAAIDHPANRKIVSGISERGDTPFLLPPVVIAEIPASPAETDTIERIADFDWLVLIDGFCVDFLIGRLRESNFDLFDLDGVTICALGETTADHLRFAQLHADVVPQKTDETTVFRTIEDYVSGNFEGLRFLVVGPAAGAAALIGKLTSAGAAVRALEIYRTESLADPEIARKTALFRGGAVDEFIFAADEDLLALKHLFPDEPPAEILREISVYAAHERIFQTLSEHGLRPLFIPPEKKG